jgi:glycosyltransferase involved in cell wall biosynthesis
LVEENWTSMELVADMLLQHLNVGHAGDFSATRLCPPLRAHFGRAGTLKHWRLLYNADRLANRFIDYPRWLQRQASDFDLFHIIDHSYAQLVHCLPPSRTIVTCHDLDAFRCLLEPQRENRPRWFRAIARRILAGFRRAAHIIAVSNATRDAVLRYGLVPPERVSVIPNGVNPRFSALPDPVADAEVSHALPGAAEGTIWLLNVGSTMPRKRLDVLLRVFAAVRESLPQVRLMRVGGAWTSAQLRLAEELGVRKSVHVFPPLARGTLAAVYRRAGLLLHTSEAEGFGLPLIEALACACPVIASDLPVLREVAGPAAEYCPVADVGAWKNAVVRLLQERAQNSDAWASRREQAVVHAARFSWIETARQTTAVYKAVLHRN